MSGNFLSCNKGLKETFEVQEARFFFFFFSVEMLQWKKASSCLEGRVSSFSRDASGPSQVTMDTSGTRSCGLRKIQSPCELRVPPRDSYPVGAGPKSSSGAEVRT